MFIENQEILFKDLTNEGIASKSFFLKWNLINPQSLPLLCKKIITQPAQNPEIFNSKSVVAGCLRASFLSGRASSKENETLSIGGHS